MPRKAGKIPAYCLHNASGRAVVRFDGADHYLGPYGSDLSHANDERVITEWRVNRTQYSGSVPRSPTHASAAGYTVEEVLGLYWQFAKSYYCREGVPIKELNGVKYAIRPVRRLYASIPAREFGPLALKAVRQHLVDADLCRNQINARVNWG